MNLTPASAQRLELPNLCHAAQPGNVVHLHLHRLCSIRDGEGFGASAGAHVLYRTAPVEDHADEDDGEEDEYEADNELADLLGEVGLAGLELAHELEQPRLLSGALVLEVELLVGGRGGGGAWGQWREGYDGWAAAVVGVGRG